MHTERRRHSLGLSVGIHGSETAADGIVKRKPLPGANPYVLIPVDMDSPHIAGDPRGRSIGNLGNIHHLHGGRIENAETIVLMTEINPSGGVGGDTVKSHFPFEGRYTVAGIYPEFPVGMTVAQYEVVAVEYPYVVSGIPGESHNIHGIDLLGNIRHNETVESSCKTIYPVKTFL